MPTPFCRSELHPEKNGEYCFCEFCGHKFTEKCPEVENQEICSHCIGPVTDCKSFDDAIWKEYSDYIHKAMYGDSEKSS